MKIWKREISLEQLNAARGQTLTSHLDIEVTEIGEDYLIASMPVNHKTRQPFGVLHGGASIALAETVGSIAANLAVDDAHYCFGLDVNGNHLKSVTGGKVYATAKAHHLGQSTQVWEIRICDPAEQLICIARLTMAVLKRN